MWCINELIKNVSQITGIMMLHTNSPPHFSSSACLSPRKTDYFVSEKNH